MKIQDVISGYLWPLFFIGIFYFDYIVVKMALIYSWPMLPVSAFVSSTIVLFVHDLRLRYRMSQLNFSIDDEEK